MEKSSVYAVILAGGNSERLWPLSRRKHPKQLLPFMQHKSLLEQTIERISPLIPLKNRWVVTSQEHEEQVYTLVEHNVGHIIVEPEARNTAPAMLLAASMINQEDPEALIIFLPSDHYIPQTDLFLEFVNHALDHANQQAPEEEKIILLGLKPTHASISYGYIRYKNFGTIPAPIESFHEKPDEFIAQEYLKQNYLWNSGIVVTKAKAFIQICQEVNPELSIAVQDYVSGCGDYSQAPAFSVDYGILEKTNKISVLPVDFIWSDVGNLETFLALTEQTQKTQQIIEIDAKDNLVETEESLVALVGVENLCVIQRDDILLVVHRNQVQKVKQILDALKKEHHEEYL